MAYTMQQRRDTAANWTSANPTLAAGEIGFETDAGRFKIGNGSTAWASLAYEDSQPANPTATIGLTAVNGSATTFMRSDGAPPLSQAIAPTWTGVHTHTPAARSSGVSPYYTINAPADTGITASTEAIGISFVGATRTHNTGSVTLQRDYVYGGITHAFSGASTITEAVGHFFEGPTAGTNATFTRNRCAVFSGSVVSRAIGGTAGTNEIVISNNLATGVSTIESLSGPMNFSTAGTTSYTFIQSAYGGVAALDFANGWFMIRNDARYAFGNLPGSTGANTGIFRPAAGVVGFCGITSLNPGGISSPARSPAQIAANTNNYSPDVGMFQRWSSDASRNVTGMVAGVDGEIRYLWNVGAQNIVLTHQDAASTAANRWISSTGANLTLSADKCALCMYDATTQRWRVTLLP